MGIALAQAFGLEILSCDSGQSRRGMEIGTAAPTLAEQAQTKHHLVGCIAPTENDSVVAFLERTEAVLETPGPDLLAVGGTGLYLLALKNGLDPIPAPDPVLRQTLQNRWELEGREPLWKELLSLNSDPPHDAYQNPVRLLRALEKAILVAKGAVSAAHPPLAPKTEVFALEMARTDLHQQLERRMDQMLVSGWRQEVEILDQYSADAPCWRCIGYPELREVVRQPAIPFRTRERILEATRQYAKRQETWFRNKLDPVWISPERSVGTITSHWQKILEKRL